MNAKLNVLVITALVVSLFPSFGQKSEIKSIKQAFDSYKSAILNDKGEEAVKYVDSRTINYYSDILDFVKTADSSKVESMDVFDKLMVFTIRHRATAKEIMSFNGSDLFVYAVKSGTVGKNSVERNSIGEISLEGNFAKGQLIANGQKAPFYFHFYKEDGQWKIDLTSLFPLARVAFKRIADESELSQNEYLFSLLEFMTGRKPGAEIWIATANHQ